MLRKFLLSISAIVFLFLLDGCNDSSTSATDITFPDSNVSFSKQVLPLLTLACATYYCHSDVTAENGIKLTNYYDIMNDNPGMVMAGYPDKSLLVKVIEGTQAHLYTIPTKFSDNQKKGIRTWIKEGAINN